MRTDRLDWDDYNMWLACTAAMRSPDPNTQVGAYICTMENKPLSNGYNGTPRNIDPNSNNVEGVNPGYTGDIIFENSKHLIISIL